ncbi:class I adenylate-forming enzyme family protein [Cohnella sp. JJ-181]|uniref:class I adenylate-forming enzyme family protein n=1 Tax=Cohnella rhizoplanae TaxID=2974897 RepID=UPI0022FFA331|nr:class I adenylate-forming enzyme family protein [Cohnella sp. JJ-181]CAI6087550.1 2-succinylbenzoate--CoA ligase [Cohnella sp. JJ-181]
MLLSERLPLAASLYPEAPALMRHDLTMSYGELHHLAKSLSYALYAEGLRPGDRFALFGDPDPKLVLAFYAAVEIGAIPLLPSPLLTIPELSAIFQDAEPHMIIHDGRHAETVIVTLKLLGYCPKLFTTDEEGSISKSLDALLQQESASPPNGDSNRNVDDTAILIYTGGTTGRPKGVMHSHRGMAAWNQLSPSKGFGHDRGRRVLVLNLAHLVGQFQLWATMAAGGCLVFLDEYPADVNRIMEAVERYRITQLSTVGQLLRDLTREALVSGKTLESLVVIGCGGSVISPDTLRDAVSQFPGAIIVNNYSQAECGMSISRLFPAQHIDNPVRLRSVGRPVDLTAQGEQAFEVRILGTDGQETMTGENGEIVVRGAQTMLGYWGQLDASTNESMSDGWVRTGDVGCLDAEGYLYVLDRLKDMVIVGGSNVFCAEVEQVIATHEAVIDAAVLGVPLPDEGEVLVAFIVLQGGRSLDLKQLWAFCEPHLARHKWPTHLYILEALPRTAVDKIDKKQLRGRINLSSLLS